MSSDSHDHETHDHDRGLAHDLPRLIKTSGSAADSITLSLKVDV